MRAPCGRGSVGRLLPRPRARPSPGPGGASPPRFSRRGFTPPCARHIIDRMWRASLLVFVLVSTHAHASQRKPAPSPAPFKTTLSVAQMTNKQAVGETSAGTFVIDLRADLAPNHVGYFLTVAVDGTFAGTIVQRAVRDGSIQAGDPLSKDPAKQTEYGTGGLGVLQAEHSAEPFTRGAVGAALKPGQPDSGGSQFFVCITDQPA